MDCAESFGGLGAPRLEKGRYIARCAGGDGDVEAALALRARGFRSGASDRDAFDGRCCHVLIEDRVSGKLVCTFRLLPLRAGAEIGQSYSAQYYDLAALGGFDAPMVELGRFCIAPEARDADILRVAWGAMTRAVDAGAVRFLFGCSSFAGVEPGPYAETFRLLGERHLAPKRWLPRVKAPDVVRFARRLAAPAALDLRRAVRALPPLLRAYLAMGGWVSDHAVVDRDLGTLHVFTGLEISAIPSARARTLRMVAG
ncbi:MAG: GNAT family N-acyltransferase [Pseudomonadota bacterium]